MEKNPSRMCCMALAVTVLPWILAVSLWLAHTHAHAQGESAYPTRPVRIIVPFPPGGSNDIVGRYVGQKFTARLGQQIVIDNRAGADAIIGSIWWGMLGPAKLPRAIAARINGEVSSIVREPESVKWFTGQAADPLTATPNEFGRIIAADMTKWGEVAKKAGLAVH